MRAQLLLKRVASLPVADVPEVVQYHPQIHPLNLRKRMILRRLRCVPGLVPLIALPLTQNPLPLAMSVLCTIGTSSLLRNISPSLLTIIDRLWFTHTR
jgi:hypothetical protein